ncbi:MAG: hypothetical protein KRP56_03775 [Candidatus Methanogranum gryphiswaldense]|nr:MAG: hypothetical protein KRP56_03775 [Candidatus Methanogranum sp. U3.2.1]
MAIERRSDSIREYERLIKSVCLISNLFSENDKPYIDYRLAENMFCRCFGADNLSRSDCSVDARLGDLGVGIKTFLGVGKKPSFQKVAEFNKDSPRFRGMDLTELVGCVSELRNERIDFTKRTYGISDIQYHCLVRDSGCVSIVECPMQQIDIDRISVQGKKHGSSAVAFSDGSNDYFFNTSKSTLYSKFDISRPLLDIDVDIIEDPFDVLLKLLDNGTGTIGGMSSQECVELPLYSVRNGNPYVPEKSGINQWNAGGRARDYDEVYIPVAIRIHREHPGFFPGRDRPFDLRLPDGKTVLSAKICQQNDKALMTNPNSALGEWILRQVLDVSEGELVTYDMLSMLGINCVRVYKNKDLDYSIDFGYRDFSLEYLDN